MVSFFAPSKFYRMCAYKIALSVVEYILYTLNACLLAWCVTVKSKQAKPSQLESNRFRSDTFLFIGSNISCCALSVICLVSFALFENETFASNNHYIQSTILFHHFILLLYCDILLLVFFVTVLHHTLATHTQFLVQIKIHFFTKSSKLGREKPTDW